MPTCGVGLARWCAQRSNCGRPVKWVVVWKLLSPRTGLPSLLESFASINVVWKSKIDRRKVWTTDRLYLLLNALVDLELPLVPLVDRMSTRKENRRTGHAYTEETYELTREGRTILSQHDKDEDISFIMPTPYFLLQVCAGALLAHCSTFPPHQPSHRRLTAVVCPICSQLGDVGGDASDNTDDLMSDEGDVEVDGETRSIPRLVVNRRRAADRKTEYLVRWAAGDFSWEAATARPFNDSRTWRDMTIVSEWEAARHAGTLDTAVLATCTAIDGNVRMELRVGRVRPATGALATGEAKARRVAEATLAREAEVAEAERIEDAATAAINKLPWLIRTSMLACNASSSRVQAARELKQRQLDLQVRSHSDEPPPLPHIYRSPSHHLPSDSLAWQALARTPKGVSLLEKLSKVEKLTELNDVMKRFNLWPQLHVPKVEPGVAWLYTAVIGCDEHGTWGLRRLEGPYRQNATKLTREAGCANLLVVKAEADAERDLLYRVAASARSEEPGEADEAEGWEVGVLKELTALHELLLSDLDVCGRHFAYLAHKGSTRSVRLSLKPSASLNDPFDRLTCAVDHAAQDAKLMLVAVGDSVIEASAATRWPDAGGSVLGKWARPNDCRDVPDTIA